jgi:hypothetical protein
VFLAIVLGTNSAAAALKFDLFDEEELEMTSRGDDDLDS